MQNANVLKLSGKKHKNLHFLWSKINNLWCWNKNILWYVGAIIDNFIEHKEEIITSGKIQQMLHCNLIS